MLLFLLVLDPVLWAFKQDSGLSSASAVFLECSDAGSKRQKEDTSFRINWLQQSGTNDGPYEIPSANSSSR